MTKIIARKYYCVNVELSERKVAKILKVWL